MYNYTASIYKTFCAICVFYCFLICFALVIDRINFRRLSHDAQRLTDIIKNSDLQTLLRTVENYEPS